MRDSAKETLQAPPRWPWSNGVRDVSRRREKMSDSMEREKTWLFTLDIS